MNVTKYKEFLLEGEFCTDGDFYLDLENYELKESGFIKYFNHNEESERYSFSIQTDDIYKIRDFLENLIVIYRCGSNHYYLVSELYNITQAVLNIVFNEDKDFLETYISGNYDGTHITLNKFE